ncbi:hypothetical protein, partial [Leptospira interrogans]|uniref:hypothetical protein n=1 Tax=Leptospira interrogans TaxID=173 RepID=UPI002158B00B
MKNEGIGFNLVTKSEKMVFQKRINFFEIRTGKILSSKIILFWLKKYKILSSKIILFWLKKY